MLKKKLLPSAHLSNLVLEGKKELAFKLCQFMSSDSGFALSRMGI